LSQISLTSPIEENLDHLNVTNIAFSATISDYLEISGTVLYIIFLWNTTEGKYFDDTVGIVNPTQLAKDMENK
jgi:hypothetical protein